MSGNSDRSAVTCPDIEPWRLSELRAAIGAESISYGELAEIDEAFEQIDPYTLPDLPENATVEDKLHELEIRPRAQAKVTP